MWSHLRRDKRSPARYPIQCRSVRSDVHPQTGGVQLANHRLRVPWRVRQRFGCRCPFPPIEDTLIIALPCLLDSARSRKLGKADFIAKTTPVRLISDMRFQSARLTSSMPFPRWIAALLTRRSIPPKRLVASYTAASQSSSRVKSRWTNIAWPPSAAI